MGLRNRVLADASRAGLTGRRELPRLKRLAAKFLRELDLAGYELSLTLVRDAEIKRLNRQWRKKDKATDVLSFPADPHAMPEIPGQPLPLGDIVISMETAQRAATRLDTGLRHELNLYLAHGLLHLLGHDHHGKAEAKRMAGLEMKLLGAEGMLRRSDTA